MRNYIFAMVAVVLLSGCEKDTGLVIVSGTVSYQGKPIEEGSIRFIPTADTKGPTSGATIQNGTYEAKARGGVPVGSHRVEIQAMRPTGKAKPKELQGLDIIPDPMEQYLPEKYNVQSELTLTVESGRTMTQNFDLE